MHARIYVRASASDQDPRRALPALRCFARQHDLQVVGTHIENASGAKLHRPELLRLLEDSAPGDVILLEGIDRLTRLNQADWNTLRTEIAARQIRIVSMDLPTSTMAVSKDEFTARIAASFGNMLVEALAALAYKDLLDRKRRAAEGVIKARALGKFRGRKPNEKRNAAVAKLLRSGTSWSEIMATLSCSRSTVARVSAELRAVKEGEAS